MSYLIRYYEANRKEIDQVSGHKVGFSDWQSTSKMTYIMNRPLIMRSKKELHNALKLEMDSKGNNAKPYCGIETAIEMHAAGAHQWIMRLFPPKVGTARA